MLEQVQGELGLEKALMILADTELHNGLLHVALRLNDARDGLL